ncbi:MAG: ABC transporter ATP-binding protein [Nitrospirota bacterium]|nr:ABC transporter ATP-binding protein [Nitrospirota bacterium]
MVHRGVVTLDHIGKQYRQGRTMVTALRDLCLHVGPGEFCALMGPSGCGKSTVLNLIAGLDCPTEGTLELDGRLTADFSDQEWTRLRRECIGLVFQAFHLLPGLSAAENVALPLFLSGRGGRAADQRAAECLGAVGMRGRERHRPGELSGGEQQRVAIARALVHQPKLLLADEPTGNLDSKQGAEIIALLRSLPQRFGATVIMATHSREAAQQADTLHRLLDGCLEPQAEHPTL